MTTDTAYPSLGRSGLKVSPLWLGTMMFGDQTDEAEAARIVDSAREAGLNCIDTADVYAQRRVGAHRRPAHLGRPRRAGCWRPRSATR